MIDDPRIYLVQINRDMRENKEDARILVLGDLKAARFCFNDQHEGWGDEVSQEFIRLFKLTEKLGITWDDVVREEP